MNREIGEKWIVALSKYPQTKRFLGHGDARCCLGVLCDMAVEAGVIPPPIVERYGTHIYAGHNSTLPEAVIRWAEMRSDNGLYDRGDVSLAVINDSGATFAEIAVTIREHMEEL